MNGPHTLSPDGLGATALVASWQIWRRRMYPLIVRLLLCSALVACVQAVPTIPQLQTRLAPEEAGLDALWDEYYGHLSKIQIDGKPVRQLLGPLVEYKYSLSPEQLRRASFNVGSKPQMRRVVWNMLTGRKAVKIGVIGTSVSWGTGATKRGTTDWVSMLPVALGMVFPHAKITVRNGCFPATGSSFANMCLSHMADPDTSLLVMEFVTNDFVMDNFFTEPLTRAFERLVRKALRMAERPAVVLMQVPTWAQCFNDTHPGKKPFHASAEDMYGTVAQYYGLPVMSYRGAFWHEVTGRTAITPNGWIDVTQTDLVHPNDRGHRAILDMFVWLTLQTAIDLLLKPLSRADVQAIAAPPISPLHPGNWDEASEMCLLEESLRGVADPRTSLAWTFVNEGTAEKRKFGWVSTTPGTSLLLQLNMSSVLGLKLSPGGNGLPEAQRKVAVAVSYLQSYTNMGIANITCAMGCVCPPRALDSHHEQKTSTTFMMLHHVEAVEDVCHLAVTISHASTSGGHKFKVTAVMINRVDSLGFHWPTDKAAQWQIHELFTGEFGATQIDT